MNLAKSAWESRSRAFSLKKALLQGMVKNELNILVLNLNRKGIWSNTRCPPKQRIKLPTTSTKEPLEWGFIALAHMVPYALDMLFVYAYA